LTARFAAPGTVRLTAAITSALILFALLTVSAGQVRADVTNVTASKTSNATNPQPLNSSYSYTISGTVGALAVTGLQVKDSSIDDPQVTATSATWSLNGGATSACAIAAGSNVTCSIGAAAAADTFEVIITVSVPSVANTACANPNGSGTLDTTVINRASIGWSDADGGPFSILTANHTVHLDCSTATLPNRDVTRLFGANRYDTAAKLSQLRTPTPGGGVPVVYVATGQQFPDALAGAPAAHGEAGTTSILLVQQTLIPNETKAELTRLNPTKIYVLGGPAVISDAVVTGLGAYAGAGGVERLSGANRYATAAAIVLHAFPTTASSVIIANGTNFPDALAGGAAAAATSTPILLTQPGTLPAETTAQLNRLNPSTIYVLGGTVSVSTAVENALKARGNSPTVTRLAGDDRYETAVAISQHFFPTPPYAHIFVATGAIFPDALAAGPHGEPLLLTRQDALPLGAAPAPFLAVGTEVTRLNPPSVTVLGGPTIISDNVITQLQGT
jgi:putative cell wall-binding protein